MTCRGCRQENAANRRYCGGCGECLVAACAGCGFSNAVDDRYCGGCGNGLGTVRAPVTERPAPTQHNHAHAVAEIPDELRGLFERAAPEPTALPQAGIGQDDLDKLFGVEA